MYLLGSFTFDMYLLGSLSHEKVLKLQGFRDFFFFCCGPENRLISNSFLTPSFELSTGKKATHLVHYGLLPSHIQMPVDIGGHFYI